MTLHEVLLFWHVLFSNTNCIFKYFTKYKDDDEQHEKYQTLLKFNLNSNHHELIYDGFYFQRFFLLKLLNNASICWHTAPPPGVG